MERQNSRPAGRRRLGLGVGLLAAATTFAVPANADTVDPGNEGDLARLVRPEHGQHACFARVYDAEHLKRHPKQKVTEMEFRLAYHRFDPDQFFPQGQRNYYFELRAKLRGADRVLQSMGECSLRENRIFCGVDCDGGGVNLRLNSDPAKVTVFFGDLGRLRMAGCDGDEEGETVDLVPGEDDKEFLLTKMPEAGCPAYDDW